MDTERDSMDFDVVIVCGGLLWSGNCLLPDAARARKRNRDISSGTR